jgi:hypothetical protein
VGVLVKVQRGVLGEVQGIQGTCGNTIRPPYTLPLPIEPMEILVVFNIEVEVLEEPITPKLVLIVLPKIGIGVKVTLINSVTHAFEVFCFGYNTKIYTYYGETISSYDSFDYTY